MAHDGRVEDGRSRCVEGTPMESRRWVERMMEDGTGGCRATGGYEEDWAGE